MVFCTCPKTGRLQRGRSYQNAAVVRICLATALLCGCIAKRDFRSPADRPREGTPYTLRAAEVEVGVELLGQGVDDLGADLQLDVGITDRLEAGINLAHAVVSAVNVDIFCNIVDKERWGVGAGVGFLWVHPRTVWALPDSKQADLGDIDMFGVPLQFTGGWTPLDVLGINLTAGYLHGEVIGTINTETTLFDGSVGARVFFLSPQIDIFALQKLRIYGRAYLPAVMYVRSEVQAEVTLLPGIRAGARSAEWVQVASPISRAHGVLGVDLKLGRLTRLNLFVVIRGPLSRADVIRSPVLPGFGLSWRLGGKRGEP